MDKIGRVYREKFINLLQDEAQNAEALLFVNFNGLGAPQINSLRMLLRERKSKLLVAKNRLIHKAFLDKNIELQDVLKAETAIVYSCSDFVEATKALFDFYKENEKLQIKGSYVKENLMSRKELENISKLPSRGILVGMTVNCIASPLTSFLSSLNQIILKFAWAIEAIREKKEAK